MPLTTQEIIDRVTHEYPFFREFAIVRQSRSMSRVIGLASDAGINPDAPFSRWVELTKLMLNQEAIEIALYLKAEGERRRDIAAMCLASAQSKLSSARRCRPVA